MSAADLRTLRKETKKYIDYADERVVKMVYAMLEADAENNNFLYSLTAEQEAILDECMELDEKGLMKYSTWADARARITSNNKNEL
jgi:hypothetical protein